jgi:hypothetical protein
MATSPSHKWGQIIGQEFLEVALEPLISAVAAKHGLYPDRKGPRAARTGRKISWVDLYGNTHDLDFVLERNGSATQIGAPVAFIESAWRRYTKHSRNKAQEIQGAILPLVTTHQHHAPFIGVILAGDFTGGSLTQLTSLGFRVLYFPYDAIMAASASAGIDARFDEDTPDAECLKKVRAWDTLSQAGRNKIAQQLLKSQKAQVNEFMRSLELAVTRTIKAVVILAPKFVNAPITFIKGDDEQHTASDPSPNASIRFHTITVPRSTVRSWPAKVLDVSLPYQPPLHPQLPGRG